MNSEIYGLVQTWLNEIFDENMPLRIWQSIYGAEVITSRSDLVSYLSEIISVGVMFTMLILILMAFGAVFKLVLKVIKWY